MKQLFLTPDQVVEVQGAIWADIQTCTELIAAAPLYRSMHETLRRKHLLELAAESIQLQQVAA